MRKFSSQPWWASGFHEAQLWDKVGHVHSPHNNQLSELIGNRPGAGEHCPSGLLLTR